MKKYIPTFIEFSYICQDNRPEHKVILDILNLQKVIYNQMSFKWKLLTSCSDLERKLTKLKQKEEATNQRIDNLKQEESNRWDGLYGN
jgi:cell division protein FtsB